MLWASGTNVVFISSVKMSTNQLLGIKYSARDLICDVKSLRVSRKAADMQKIPPLNHISDVNLCKCFFRLP